MLSIAMLFLVVSVSESRILQTTCPQSLELMSKYLKVWMLTASDTELWHLEALWRNTFSKNNAGSNSSDTARQDNVIALLKQCSRKCNDSQAKKCTELLIAILQSKIQLIVEGDKKSPGLYRDLPLNIICFDGVIIKTYDPETQVCCNGIVTESDGYDKCCNKSTFDSREQFCCNDEIHNKTDVEACCGTVLYNTSAYMCCKGTLQHKIDGAICCDNQAYDEQKQVCCSDRKVFNKTQGDSCCGDNVYNSTTHLCCETTVQRTYYGIRRKTDQCCGNVSFHSECSMCNNRELSTILEDTLCCDGALKERKYGNYSACCLKEVMHISIEICRKDKIYPKVESSVNNHIVRFYGNVNEDVVVGKGPPITHRPNSDDVRMTVVIIIGGITGTAVVTAITCTMVYLWRNRRKRQMQSNHIALQSQEENDSIRGCIDNEPFCKAPNHNKPELAYSVESDPGQPLIPDASFQQSVYLDEHDLMKKNTLNGVNSFTEYFKCSSTQTYAEKVPNRRNILGKTFDYTEHLDVNKSTLQMPNSEVKMTLPHSVLRDGSVEVNASTFRCINDLQKKLDISSDEKMASPAVEYVITGYTNLKDYAVVVMPFVGCEEDLRVKKFRSDDGLRDVAEILVVHRQGKTNEELDMYYIIQGTFVYIYTKSFSGFYCTTCKHNHELKVRAFVYGSYKRFHSPLRYEVCMIMYLADDILKFADYKERMHENEAGRIFKKDKLLKLPEHLTENDTIQATLTPTNCNKELWIPKRHPRFDRPIHHVNQSVNLSEIAEKCKDCTGCHLVQHEIPYCMEWYFTCPQEGVGQRYQFQCIIDISTSSLSGKEDDYILMDELQLRQEDRNPIDEDSYTRCIRGVKEYLNADILPRKRTELLKELVYQTKSTGQTVEDLFFNLQEKYTSKGLLEAVATAMKSLRMYDDIDKLTKCGYLPRTLSAAPLQPVTVEEPPTVDLLYTRNRMPVPEEPLGAVGGIHMNGEQDEPRAELSHPNNNLSSMEGSTLKTDNDKPNIVSLNELTFSQMGPVRRELDSHIQNISSERTSNL